MLGWQKRFIEVNLLQFSAVCKGISISQLNKVDKNVFNKTNIPPQKFPFKPMKYE